MWDCCGLVCNIISPSSGLLSLKVIKLWHLGRCHVCFSILFLFFLPYADIIMSSRVSKLKSSAIWKSDLLQKISDNGFTMVFSCTWCAHLGKTCIKSDDSDCCNECVKEGGWSCCVEMKPSYSDAEWHYLVRAQHSIKDEEEALLMKLLWLQKQEHLLREWVNEFISHEFQEISELEEMEEKECQACEDQETLVRQQEKVVAESCQLAAMSDDPSLTQMMNSPLFWSDISLSTGDIPSPCCDNLSSAQ